MADAILFAHKTGTGPGCTKSEIKFTFNSQQYRSLVLLVLSSRGLQNRTLSFFVAQQLLPFVQPRPLIR
jgi:hypothetical protein